METEKRNFGITLITVVITVIVMLILAGVAIHLTIGENGIFKKASEGAEIYKNSANDEMNNLNGVDSKMGTLINQYYGENSVPIEKPDDSGKSENLNEIRFYQENHGFQDVIGETKTNSYGLSPQTFINIEDTAETIISTGMITKCEKIENRKLEHKFEVSFQIYFNNETSRNMGGIQIKLLKNNEEKIEFGMNDAWGANNNIQMAFYIENNQVIYQKWSRYNGSGRYAMVSDGEKIYFYWGTELLGSIDYTKEIFYDCDKIAIYFHNYGTNYPTPPMYIESIYIGEPFYYKSMIE